MFRENKKYQVSLFGIVYQLPVGVKNMLDESWAPAFRRLVFDKIDERRYAVLYSENVSRPNFPVNVWVGLEILKGQFDYTDEELVRQFHFDLLTAYALGQEGLGELTVCIRTIYYNRERLLAYEAMTGRNLLESSPLKKQKDNQQQSSRRPQLCPGPAPEHQVHPRLHPG